MFVLLYVITLYVQLIEIRLVDFRFFDVLDFEKLKTILRVSFTSNLVKPKVYKPNSYEFTVYITFIIL